MPPPIRTLSGLKNNEAGDAMAQSSNLSMEQLAIGSHAAVLIERA